MKDWVHNLLKKIESAIDHNRWTALAVVLWLLFSAVLIGCSATTIGPLSGEPVTRQRFDVEVGAATSALKAEQIQLLARMEEHNEKIAALNAAVELGYEDLERQEAMRAQLIELTAGLATSVVAGTITPAGIINAIVTAGALLGVVGVAADNRRKDVKIDALKTERTSTVVRT